jgi:hypothetical protein
MKTHTINVENIEFSSFFLLQTLGFKELANLNIFESILAIAHFRQS